MVNAPRPWRATQFDIFDANGNMMLISHNTRDIVEAVNFYDEVCKRKARGVSSLPGCCSQGHPCTISDADDAVYLLNTIESLIEGKGMAEWSSINKRGDLDRIFFHISRICSKILDKWQEKGYSEEAMKAKEEEWQKDERMWKQGDYDYED